MAGSVLMADVMIGIDPHNSSHTAVAIGPAEERLGELRVHACPAQAGRLLAWAQEWPEPAWAIEGAAGLGCLLAQQLAAAGERVLDVPPKLAARVRLLQAGDTNKNDPNDALPVAVSALRSATRRPVAAEDHAAVLKVWAKRHRDLARARNQVACRLHAVLCDLLAGGVSKEITAAHAARILDQVTPSGPVAAARHDLAGQFLEDLRGLDAPAPRDQEEARRARQGLGHQPHRGLRLRPGQHRHRDRRHHRRDQVPQPGPLRLPQRHPPGRGVLGEPQDLPAVAAREPADQSRPAHGCHHPDPARPQRRPRLL
jgi:Transposase